MAKGQNFNASGGKKMKWIITGGAGFIGCNFAQRLAERGDEAVIIDNLSRPRVDQNSIWLREKYGVHTIREDIRDRNAISQVFKNNADAAAIIHLAGQVSLLDSLENPRNDFETNVSGTFNVIECFKEHIPNAHLIFSSTNKVYGDLEKIDFREEDSRYSANEYKNGFNETIEIAPAGGYGVSKCAAEFFISDWGKTFGLKTTVLRQSSIYGERQFSTSDQGWAAFFVERFLRKETFTINGNGKQVRDLLHVEDLFMLVDAILQSSGSALGTFNIGGGIRNSLSLLELFDLLSEVTGNRPTYMSGARRPHDQLVFVSDNSKICEVLGWQPTIDVHSGIMRLVNWTSDNLLSGHP